MDTLFATLQAECDELNGGGQWGRRAAAQLCYGHRVSLQADGRWDTLLRQAVDYLHDSALSEEGRCRGAEKLLAPMAADCKAYTLLLCSHSHIDLNFQWGFDETVSIVLATFRTMLALLEEYPEFIYSQSQAAAYKIAERYEPELIDGIRKYVREGRWEVTATAWVESDKNMPSGESLAHQTMSAKAYLSQLLDIPPDKMRVGFEPDTFGHNANMPEVLKHSGIDCYYFCRGEGNQNNLFNWQASGGSTVLAYKEPLWYDSRIQPDMTYTLPELCAKNHINKMMKVYGVGDHGGGPTRRDLERARDMMTWPIFPTISFGRYSDYFDYARQYADRFPTVHGDLHSIFTGCLSSQSEIKRANRKCELMLGQAEALAAFAGGKGDCALRSEGWEKTLFNQFHDILTGSCVPQVANFALGRAQEALAAANSARAHSLLRIARRIDTAALLPQESLTQDELYAWGAGAGIFVQNSMSTGLPNMGQGKRRAFHLFNTTANDRNDVAELLLWDWNENPDALSVSDTDGNRLEWQLVDRGYKEEWGHFFLRLLVSCSIPAFGYTTVVAAPCDDYRLEDTDRSKTDLLLVAENLPPNEEFNDIILENEQARFVISHRDFTVLEMLNKATGQAFCGEMGLFRLVEEDPETGGNAWVMGREMSCTELRRFRLGDVRTGQKLLRQSVSFEGEFLHSGIKVTIALDRNSSCLNYRILCDWHEYSNDETPVRRLTCAFGAGFPVSGYLFDQPFGTVLRQPRNVDVCGATFAIAQRPDGGGLLVVGDGKYGYRCVEDAIRLTLLRGSNGPDRCPEQGLHDMRLSVGFAADACDAFRQSIALANPAIEVSATPGQRGDLPISHSFLRLDCPGAVVSAVKPAEWESADLVLRLFEATGSAQTAKILLGQTVKKAWLTDFHEQAVTGTVKADKNEITAELGANCVITIAIKLDT